MEPLKVHDYNVYFGNVKHQLSEWLAGHQYSKVAMLIDGNCMDHCLHSLVDESFPVEFDGISIGSGEEVKSLDGCRDIWDLMLKEQFDRKSLLINLGGGAVGDVGGFAASCYKRGIDFIQVPTTLLAQVDASVGGKTAVNFEGIKNPIGQFANPKAVFIDTVFYESLPERQLRNGLAEMIKHGFLADETVLEFVFTGDWQNEDFNWYPHLQRSIDIKRSVVEKDFEETGYRKVLNFGHTIGHAVESFSLKNDDDPLLHGEAVAIGMICELELSVRNLAYDKDRKDQFARKIIELYGKYPRMLSQNANELLQLMQNDKKNIDNHLMFSLLRMEGEPVFDVAVNEQDIKAALAYYDALV